MEESNNFFAAAMSAIGATIAGFYAHLAPWLLLGAVLVLVDLRFGILAARTRGETIRSSRAVRRTVNKMMDYLCWVTVAELASRTFGVTIGVPVVSMGTLFVIYAIEFNSCMNNYFEYKGIKGKFDIWRLIRRRNVSEMIDDATGEAEESEEIKTDR
ncbi:phage holin family protein [uncultured Alistipes sp.]|uniref:phage holin family protein n=1 Tax=uncultured Alistipes sp. TaxID=538949 RepID=UPI00262D6051|nr:phage holin family protein [uncultured Alistipes sp.]